MDAFQFLLAMTELVLPTRLFNDPIKMQAVKKKLPKILKVSSTKERIKR